MRRHRRYTREFKLEALELYENSDKSMAEIERELGLSSGQLCHWRRQFQEEGVDAFPGKGRLAGKDEEIRRLKRENESLKQEREILKKAVRIFAQGRG